MTEALSLIITVKNGNVGNQVLDFMDEKFGVCPPQI